MKRERLAFLLGALLVAALVLLVSGCTTPKAIQRKDDKAVARVLSKEELLARVAKHISAGGDTTRSTEEKPVTDNLVYIQRVHPQTCDECERYVAALVFATTEPIDTTLPNGIRIVITKNSISATYTRRTEKQVIRDRAAERRLQDSVNAWIARYHEAQGQKANLQQQLDEANAKVAEAGKKKDTRWPWWVWLAVGFVGGALAAATILRKALPIMVIWNAIKALLNLIKKKNK